MSAHSRNRSPKRQQRTNRLGLSILTAAALALAASLGPGHTPSAQGSGPCAPPSSNPIACENALVGNPDTEWDVDGAGDASIQGFTTDISVNKGSAITFKVDTPASSIRLDIYRMGYYGGMGARKVATVNAAGQNQPDCLTDAATGLIDCGNWAVTTSWTVPSTAVSGIYFAKAIRLDTQESSHIVFVVRDDASASDLLFQTSDTTWQAYNEYGGNSLYVGGPATNPGRALKVSYNRPFATRETSPQDWVFNAEYPMVRWLEANGYNVSYSTGIDTDRRGAELLEHKLFLSVGHDEYWSGNQRANVEAARAAGVHLAFFSGNEVFWKTRWENSMSSPATSYRTLVSYKETHSNAKTDPTANVWTGTWRDPRFSPPADGGRPENALTGTVFAVNSGTAGIRVPAAEGKMRFWRNTTVASLAPGGFADLPFGTLGYEWDEDRENGFRPGGLLRLSDTTVSGVDYLQDFGSTYATGTANHALTLYRSSGNSLVFGAGTVQWSWGLDSHHDRGEEDASTPMQQATVNLFADMGAQPVTLQSGLLIAAPSTDTLPPTTTISSPANGAGVPANTTITISGTATDSGGIVGAVEVSVDGGTTWRRATGRNNWTISWPTGSARPATILSRAVDDSVNMQAVPTSIAVSVGSGTVSCPCSIWAPNQTPNQLTDPDPSAVELGTRFRSDVSGYITGIRFYKGPSNVGPHTGNLWTAGGTQLSTVEFVGESDSGWQEATLPAPVAVSANVQYIVSYHTASGFYTGEDGYFLNGGVDNGPLHAPQYNASAPNGVYSYGGSAFPGEDSNGENYWVDVVFVTSLVPDTTAPTIASVTPSAGATNQPISLQLTATFGENVNPSTVTSTTFELRNSSNVLVPANVTYASAARIATLSPSTLAHSTTYTARIKGGASGVKDTAGNALVADFTWSFTTVAAPPPQPNEGPGGPILVVSSSSNPFSRYYIEILRAEGLNAFTAMDIANVTATTLSTYDVVILGEVPLSTTQVTMFTNWVNGGGNLIAMRPDKKLASLLGLTDAAATLPEGYLLVDTSASPGAGIVNQTMQYHGLADRYSLNGATQIAALYSNATTATTNPAVSLRTVGVSGGQAAAFTYDLAKSVVYTRQGNPAWSGQERDGQTPKRSDDLFFGGGTTPDWVDFSKIAIPQADEQQRLLANLIALVNADKKPLPKFWYFPRGEKAAVVMTGDDHGHNGTAGRFDVYKGNSPANCNVNNWECVRATSYIYPSTPISDAEVAGYIASGFEIGVHMTTAGPNSCGDFSPASLEANYSNDIESFMNQWASAPAPKTNRTHCIAWSDYDTQPQVAFAHGIRLDTNYYYWPAAWVLDRPGLMTGSGMPMRFAKADGSLIDVYQAATQMTDESDQSWPFTVDTLLDRAIGPLGYYGFFTANMHTDTVSHVGSEAIVASALARSVPVISAQQLLTWLDGRNGSTFTNITWNGTTLGFSVTAAAGANGLETMVPSGWGTKTLTGITRSGSPVSYRAETIKGVTYAIFPSTTGAYQLTFGTDTAAPTISGIGSSVTITSATITWSTNEAADSRVDYGTSAAALTSSVTVASLSSLHTVNLPGLTGGTTYFFRVRSADASGNATTSPLAPAAPATFTTTAAPVYNCPCSIWAGTATPGVPNTQDPTAAELGVKFRASVNGYITGIRFYKGTQNTGTHTGNLWTTTGTSLATAVFSNETASGWQQVIFDTPVQVTAGSVYVASYHTTSGFYSSNSGQFQGSGVINGPLEALANGVSGANGVYRYSGTSVFPTDAAGPPANYWVDVVFITALPIDVTAPIISNLTLIPSSTTAAVAWTTSENATSRVDYGTSPSALTSNVAPAGVRTTHSITLTGLFPSTTYYYRVTSADAAGNSTSQPPAAGTFLTNGQAFTLGDSTAANFAVGSPNAGITVGKSGDGELILSPTVSATFDEALLPAGWSAVAWNAGGTATTPAGALVVDGARAHTDAFFGPGTSLEFAATFANVGSQHAGLGNTLNETPWAIFSTGSGGSLYARTHNGASAIDTPLPGPWLDAPHRYRIDWTASAVVFWIDGVQVANHATAIASNMRPIASDYDVNAGTLNIDWLRMSPYAATGTFVSRVLDAGSVKGWTSAVWTALAPTGTTVSISARFGNTSVPDGSWTPMTAIPASGALSASSRFVQYQVVLGSSNPLLTPEVQDIGFVSTGATLPSISIADASVAEGHSGITTVAVTLTLSTPTASAVTVTATTANGTATAGSDYTTTSGTVTFAPGTSSATMNLPVLGDTTIEPNETFLVSLTAPVNATIGDGQATVTIVNDDVLPTLSISDASVTETNGGSTAVTFTVTLAGTSANTVTVPYSTANQTATSGSDYSSTSGTLTFPVGTTSRTISVNVLGDTLDEIDETFLVNLGAPTNATIADGQGVGTIIDNDNSPSMSVNNSTVTEGNSGSINATFTVSLSAVSGRSVTVNYATADGTATAGSDYSAVSGTLTFPAGTTSLSVTVPVLGDTLDEANETFTLNLSNVSGATLSDAQGVGTITDNDNSPSLSTADVTVTEGNSGTVNAVFTVTLSTVSGQNVSVNYATSSGTASQPADYTSTSGTLTFAPGTTTRQVTVVVKGDTLDEDNETFNLDLSNASAATIADTRGVGTITDDDNAPSVSINNVTISEGDTLTKTATFTVTLSAASGRTIQLSYATANGTASSSSDYTAKNGTVTFAPGTTTQQITVTIRGDRSNENNETFFVNLSSPQNVTIADGQGVCTITDDD